MKSVPSVRKRLLVSLMMPLAVLLPIVVILAYVSAVDTARSAFDHGLADDATALASRASTRADGTLAFDLPPAAEAILRMDSDDQEYLAAWGPDGRLLAGDVDLVPSVAPPMDRPRVDDAVIRGQPVRKAEFRFATSAGSVTVVFAETLRKRMQAETRIFFSLVLPNSLLVLLAVILVHFSVSRSLEPLLRLSKAIGTRSADDVRPLEREDVDREVLPLVDAINGLMAKLAAAAAAQRRFVADAAHQLRTPLAGLQTQIDLVAADLPEGQRERVEALAAAAGRVGHLSQQLLALARSAPEAVAGHAVEDVDIAALVEDRATDWYNAALKRGVDLGFELARAPVSGTGWLVGEMLSNLVDNALRHGGRHVTVRCGVDMEGASFAEVEDDGPGIADDERSKIFDRFYRGRSSDTRGTGLGLAIVREVVDGHGGRLQVIPGVGGRGVRFVVRFATTRGGGGS